MEPIKINERQERLKKLEELNKAGINPYPAKANRTHMVGAVIAGFEDFEKSKEKLIIAGRLRTVRTHGNLSFVHLEDDSGRIQVAISKKEVGADEYKQFVKLIDSGDFVEFEGSVFVTHKGEKSLMAGKWRILTKALRPLPDKWHGLKDEEELFRKRYLDILFNPEVKETIRKKAIFWDAIREFLQAKGFLQVETPVLETTTGGADARPFISHHNALDMDVYLRISGGELWQKRLMVAGFEKTFEIGRIFRNEGMDAEHLQDYTQMEFYWAYANYEDGMDLVEELYKYVAQKTFGTLQFKIGKFDVDLDGKWERYDYQETIKKFTGIDILKTDIKEIEAKLKELKIEYDRKGFNITRAIDNLWKYCRKQLGGPGFLINVPVEISPLAKRDDVNKNVTQRFQPIIAGSELGNGYSELNDPIDQAQRFANQADLREAGDEEAQMFDHEFVEALEYGMPPTCGFGLSERVFSFLVNKPMREAQIFPLMRPKEIRNVKKTKAIQGKEIDLGLSPNQAKELLDESIKDKITKSHCVETEAIMKSLAKYLGEDKEKWGIIGLVHDIDWELTKDNPSQHCVKSAEILKQAGATDFLVEAVSSHCYGNEHCPNFANKKRETRLHYALAASETLTGLIISTALMQPEKKLANLKIESLKKKFKNKKFAANCDRDIIMECEKIGISIDDFLNLGLKSLQEIAGELGM